MSKEGMEGQQPSTEAAVSARRKGEAPIKQEFLRPVVARPSNRQSQAAARGSPASTAATSPATGAGSTVPAATPGSESAAAIAASAADSHSEAGAGATDNGETADSAPGEKRSAPEPDSSLGDSAPRSKRKRGMNKNRKLTFVREPMHERLCSLVARGDPCTYGDTCRFSHDVTAFMATRRKDLDGDCLLFKEMGRCPYGFMCRFAGTHLSADNENVINKDVVEAYKPTTVNVLSKELQSTLRRRRYDFTRADTISTKAQAASDSRRSTGDPVATAATSSDVDSVAAQAATIGAVTDEGLIKLRPAEKKSIDFSDKLYLAPLTTVGNLPFRRICKRFGADITCGEMALATQLLQGQSSEWALVKRHESEDLFGVQVAGSFPDTMTRCAQALQENCQLDFIDFNVGCPIDLIYKKGAGCALMSRQTRFETIVRSVSSVMEIPLTVKMRTGVFDKNWNAHELVPKLYDWGASLVTVHGRSREQRYTRSADWSYLERCATAANGRPFYGNGDILSYEDYEQHKEITGLSGVMLARGALIKPWLFTELKERRHWDISSSERFDILRDFANYGLMHWGSDSKGVETTRRFLLEWQSFLHRYIPVGILETLPQRINERPAPYFCRDDMETMLASDNCQDWVKISEMLIGPVPDSFSFLPKHRANSYAASGVRE